MIERREAASTLLLLALVSLPVLLVDLRPGPGPLALTTAAAALHAALLGPAMRARARLVLPLALPAVCATSYGHPGALPLLGSLLLVALAACAGGFGRHARSYLPSMLLVFFAPYALRYLVAEFGKAPDAESWLALSPVAAAERVAGGAWPPALCVLLLLAWPVGMLLSRRTRRSA